jgi:hypothetical protein
MKTKTFLLIFLTMLVPASMFLVPSEAQEQPSLEVSTELGGIQEIPLKAIQSDGEIDTQSDFEIEPQNIVTLAKNADFHVLPDQGSVFAIKITDEQRETIDLQFSKTHGTVVQGLASKAYLLDIVVLMDNNDKYLYETVLAILEPGQTLNQVNTQNIIQNFVSSESDTHTTVVFRDSDSDDNDNEPDKSREEICRFTPSHPICSPNEDGECGEGFAMNEDGNCFPRGDCPQGYARPNDDESGACIEKEGNLDQCSDGSWKYISDSCYGEDPTPTPAIEEEITALTPTPTPEPEEEPETEEEPPVNENGEPLTSNCGGQPCSASEKEDSWTSDVPESSPGVPIEEEEEETD